MSTKWKHATIPATQRLDMLKGGNKELYDEEIARTQDAIVNRLGAGLDVSEQMAWADTVSYNYNLGQAQKNGLSGDTVAKTGYADKLFGDLKVTGPKGKTSTVSSPQKVSSYGYDSLADELTRQKTAALNSRIRQLNAQYNEYQKVLDAQYAQYEKEAIQEYEDALKIANEAAVNGQRGGLSESDKLKMKENLNSAIANYRNGKAQALSQAKGELDKMIYGLYSQSLSDAPEDYYKYYSLLSDKEALEYQKQRDAAEDNKWYTEFTSKAQKESDELSWEKEKENAYIDRWQKEYDMEKEENDRDFYLESKQSQSDDRKFYTDFYRWYQEFVNRISQQKSEEKQWEKEYELKERKADESSSGSFSDGDEKDFGTGYYAALEYARMLKDLKGSQKYSDKELADWIDSLDLSEKEKKAIAKDIGISL